MPLTAGFPGSPSRVGAFVDYDAVEMDVTVLAEEDRLGIRRRLAEEVGVFVIAMRFTTHR